MQLEERDRLVHTAAGTVRLDSVPSVFEFGQAVSFEGPGEVLADPDEDLLFFLLNRRYPGVRFALPDEKPGFHEGADTPLTTTP